uniref:open rectifier potassium channel protein 1 isoform X1 n=1 Tax=Osmia lignaria TaxID=473952 RepID=UPI0014793161|nr:open rectifier potassium channel protein 1 isoform X1 [Osmia lignaria]XP_034189165.1 open rectifier potassium channel protein 1 isoform X1 [Osmia lignaria]XP_034189166.1 open rectifier potassium channel protein 1 isoform X1 [Osmia lignaria]XP_034189167.1 open rectifier potassium channel protein 1 isoform X1 [Osmia lignaria]XP_034189168.1 open rectifier potassium channel protein 1 isoform X1 [Osmia lignaria]XP_034189169.1 open rectifier potassium channel protein 1 isoform X1 [Osmia lignaria]
MSKKQWMVLLMLFLTYLLLGAFIFYHIESRLEIERVEKAKREQIEINALLQEHYMPSDTHDYDEIFEKLSVYCGKSVSNYTEGKTDPLKWDFYNSFYFAYTVVSTIGYGNLAPTNMLSRILMIFYGLVGIPINGILLTQLGEFFGRVFVKAHEKYKSYKQSRNDYYPRKLTTFETRKVGLAIQILVHLLPGFVMFIFFPAFLFSYYEGWSYDESVYYAFVTLTTIGFGDYVAGKDNTKGSGIFFILYKAFLICWISFGLGYTVMIMTFIARGMRSKKIIRIEHKLAVNLKHTQSKIWNELNKEMNYLRRVFNELQLSKVKRIYVDECNYEVPLSKSPRSNSFPDLRDLLYGKKDKDGICQRPRRRANSEVVPTEDEITRVVSETDLQRIDKRATFATHAMVQPAELLARLVNILGYIPPAAEDPIGVADCSNPNQTSFVEENSDTGVVVGRYSKIEDNSEKELLAKKESMYASSSGGHGGTWTIGHDKIPRFLKPRSRAVSEVRLNERRYLSDQRSNERTWSGPTAARKMQELMKTANSEMPNESSNKDRSQLKDAKFSKFRSFALAKNWFSSTSTEKKTLESEREINQKDIATRSLVSGRYDDKRRDSKSSVVSNSTRHYYTHTGAGNPPIESEGSNLLEETSVADFFRALTLLHASVATSGSWTASATDNDDHLRRNQPRRKMGTASLTPPKLPSLFTLFSSPQPTTTTTATLQESSVNDNNSVYDRGESRRNSLTFVKPTVTKSRRFSLRPVATPISPPTPPRNTGSPFLSGSRRTSYVNRSTFSFESPKEPLITTEQAPGLSSPIKSSFNGRRFSLRPIPNQPVIGVTTAKPLPRWKGGMLQRQIGQMNLRRRARAFSLSDVQPYNPKGTSDRIRKNVFMHQVSNDGKPVVSRVTNIESNVQPTTLNTISDNTIDPSNESTSFATADNKTVENNTKKEQLFTDNHAYTTSSLVEVKVENPEVKNTVERFFPKTKNESESENESEKKS